jgi:hypothetical protein
MLCSKYAKQSCNVNIVELVLLANLKVQVTLNFLYLIYEEFIWYVQIFEKALDEPKYSSLYAQLCHRLFKDAPNFEPPDSNITVSSIILCYRFESRNSACPHNVYFDIYEDVCVLLCNFLNG